MGGRKGSRLFLCIRWRDWIWMRNGERVSRVMAREEERLE